MKRGKNIQVRILFYIFGFLVMTLGIAISVKSDLGVSPVSSIPYTITCVWGIEMGRATILFHIVLVLFQILILRKKFQVKNFLQIPVGVLFGMFTTLCNSFVSYFPSPESIEIKLVMMLISTVLIAFGIFLYVPANFIPLAGEGVMLAISKVTDKKFSSVKLVFDISMVVISFTTCFVLLHSLGSVGIGTVIAAVLVGSELKLITRALGSYRDRILSAENSDITVIENPLISIMKKNVYTVHDDTSLFEALKLFTEKGISGVPVVDQNNDLTGFISDGDIIRYISSEHPLFVSTDSLNKIDFNKKVKSLLEKKVSDIKRKNVITVNVEDDMQDVCYKMSEYHLKKSPVMHNGKMIGIINSSNITKYVVSMMA